MHRLGLCITCLLVMVGLSVRAGAYPSLNGITGTTNLPTARIAEPGTIALALDVADFDSTTAEAWRILYGINNRAEAAALLAETERTTWGLGAKYLISRKPAANTAVGVLYFSTSPLTLEFPPGAVLPRTDTFQVYLVRTFVLSPGGPGRPVLGASLGANWTTVSATGFDENAVRLFASAQARYGKTALAVDYQTKSGGLDDEPMWSAVVHYDLTPQWGIEAGFSNSLIVVGGDTTRFFGGIGYRFVTD